MLDRNKIRIEYLKGVPVRDLAKKYDVTRERIYQLLRADPLWNTWKRNHYCMKHKRELNIILEAKNRRELRVRLGVSDANLTSFLKRFVKRGCIDKKVIEGFIRNKNIAEEIRNLVRKGMRNKDIAKKLGVSQFYVAVIKYKMLEDEKRV